MKRLNQSLPAAIAGKPSRPVGSNRGVGATSIPPAAATRGKPHRSDHRRPSDAAALDRIAATLAEKRARV